VGAGCCSDWPFSAETDAITRESLAEGFVVRGLAAGAGRVGRGCAGRGRRVLLSDAPSGAETDVAARGILAKGTVVGGLAAGAGRVGAGVRRGGECVGPTPFQAARRTTSLARGNPG